MNTTALRTASMPRHSASHASVRETLRSTTRDFVSGLLGVTKSTLLSGQTTRPHLRRF